MANRKMIHSVKNLTMTVFKRGLKTAYTNIHSNDQNTRNHLLHNIKVLDNVLNRTTYNKTLLLDGKYNNCAQLLSSKQTKHIRNTVQDILNSLQLSQAYSLEQQRDPVQKLGKIGLQLFMESFNDRISPIATSLTLELLKIYNKCPQKDTVDDIVATLDEVRSFLAANRIALLTREELIALTRNITNSSEDAIIVEKVLRLLNFKPFSTDRVRVVCGKKTDDELEVSKGWEFPSGIPSENKVYLRSLGLSHRTNSISYNVPSLVLLVEGSISNPTEILPSLHHASRQNSPLLIITSGNVSPEALSAISSHNNIHRRRNSPSQVVLLRYKDRDHNGLSIRENYPLANFLGLPNGLDSIYSSQFSSHVPCKISASSYYGSLASITATTDRCLLHNLNRAHTLPKHLQQFTTTITLTVGAHSHLEMLHRKFSLDVIINESLHSGLIYGFIPPHEIALAKCASRIPDTRFREDIQNALTTPMLRMLLNLYAISLSKASSLISQSLHMNNFYTASFPDGMLDVRASANLEPLKPLDDILLHTKNFIRLITKSDKLITLIFDTQNRKLN